MHREALLYEQQSRQKVRCCLCPHRCLIEPSCYGFCGVRYNQGGKLVSLVYGYPAALAVDPIEKKPLYHFLPGSKTYSLATLGCNFKCRFCQNWQISQTRPLLNNGVSGYFSAENIVAEAMRNQCESIAYTYSEPTVFFEYVWDIAKLAKTNNLKNVFITNGYISKEAIKLLSVNLDAVNIDLKSFREEFYRDNCRGSLAPVLETIEFIKESDVWMELTTLLIPGE
ncbi:MAG: AmmeMemoRadiSam system radical SAM enzyme, partial [Candidatus Omnitrophica bacterium]|nr:AmmeMemoRadiSam system radical SAM enzyme [Candidatus Omnitrophota bacterium]